MAPWAEGGSCQGTALTCSASTSDPDPNYSVNLRSTRCSLPLPSASLPCFRPRHAHPHPNLSTPHLNPADDSSDLSKLRHTEPQTNATPSISRQPPPTKRPAALAPHISPAAGCSLVGAVSPQRAPSPHHRRGGDNLRALYFGSPSARRANWKVGKEGAGLGTGSLGSRDAPPCFGAARDWLVWRGLCEMSDKLLARTPLTARLVIYRIMDGRQVRGLSWRNPCVAWPLRDAGPIRYCPSFPRLSLHADA